MKWPFFKSNQTETKTNTQGLAIPPRPPANPASYRLKKTQPLTGPVSEVQVDETQTVSIPLSTVAGQLPPTLFTPDIAEKFADTILDIPAESLVSQLPKGKVTLTVGEILDLLPPGEAPTPATNTVRQQLVKLPMDLVVRSIPPEVFATCHSEDTPDDDDDELNSLPALFDDEFIARAEAATASETSAGENPDTELPAAAMAADPLPAPAQDVPEEGWEAGAEADSAPIFAERDPDPAPSAPSETQRIPLPPLPDPAPAACSETRASAEPDSDDLHEPVIQPEPATDAVAETASALPSGVPHTISVSLHSMIDEIPEEILASPRAELKEKTDSEQTINLPTAPILSMLTRPRVVLPLATVLSAIPAELVVSPLPDTTGKDVSLPLSEIIPQLPPSVFMPVDAEAADETDPAEDVDLNNVFQEREAAPPLPEPTAPEPVAVEPEPEPAEATNTTDNVAAPEVSENRMDLGDNDSDEADDEDLESTFGEIDDETPIFSEAVAATAATEQPETVDISTPEVGETETETASDSELLAVNLDPVDEPATGLEAETSSEPIQQSPSPHDDEPAPLAVAASEPEPERGRFDLQKFLVNINTCCVDDLTNIPGIGKSMAQRVIDFREARGKFESIQQLRQIPGIGRKTFRALAGVSLNSINRALRVEDGRELSLQEIVKLTAELKGIDGCILTSSDGLFLTGQLPEHLDENRLSVFAPQLFKKVGSYAGELSVGQVHRMTMFTDQQPVSIFQSGDIYLIVIHDTRHFSKALLRRLTRISEGIARLCRQRAIV